MNNIVKQKIKEIEENLETIKENIPDDIEEFKSLGLVKDGIYKRLEFCIQNLVDIFSIIYSSLNLGVPSDLDDIFDGLKEGKILPTETVSLVQDMKGLRNILIHKYGKIDDGIVHGLLTENLDDFDKIIGEMERYFKEKEVKKDSK